MPDDRRVLEGIGHMVVDGTNVLHALSRSSGPLPPVAIIGRLRAIVPPGVAITVVLDGSPEHGLVARHVASGVEVRYSGRSSGDDLIAHLLRAGGPQSAEGVLVVTDDIELSGIVRGSGGRTVRTGWLIDRLGRQRLAAPAPGRPRSPFPPGAGRPGDAPADEEEDEAPRWSPGRGATRKRGNARRRPSRGR
jgi:hypothetical protein